MTIERNAVNSSSPKCLLFEASDLREEEGGNLIDPSIRFAVANNPAKCSKHFFFFF